MASSSPQDATAPPPPERRCTGTVTSHMATEGQRCSRWAIKGTDTCYDHSGKSRPPSAPPEERRCRGFSKDENGKRTKPCKLWAMQGLNVCYRHGGARKVARAAGERRVAEAKIEMKARKLAELYGGEPVDNPLTALAQIAGEAMRFKEIVQGMVSELESVSTKGINGEQVNPKVTVYERALDRVGTILEKFARLNIDERLAAINEKQAETVIAAIDAALAHVGITGEQAVAAKKVAARMLRPA